MIFTEGLRNLFNGNIINEELPLPNRTKSARVVTHVDLDGVVSAISMVQQLIKQGIPKERIDIQFAQYGDDEKLSRKGVRSFQPRSKGEWVGTVDYAKYPKGKPWPLFGKMTDFEGKPSELIKFLNSRDWSKVKNDEDFIGIIRKELKLKETKWFRKNAEELFDIARAYSSWGKEEEPITRDNYKDYSLQLVKPDFGSDHHSNEDGALSPARRGDVAAASPSEAEFFATKYAPALWPKDDLKAVSMVDSAGYTEDELKNTIFLEKHFTGPNKKRNLATIVSVVYDNLVKKDEKAAKWIILNAGPSLVSLYSKTLEAIKLSGERLRLLQAIKNGDMKTGQEIADALPKILKKNWTDKTGSAYQNRDGKEIKPTNSLEGFRNKNLADLADAVTGRKTEEDEKKLAELKGKRGDEFAKIRNDIKSKKGKLFQKNNFTVFDGTTLKKQYGRYMGALYSVDGQRQPYMMRYWNGMFQISLNTLYKKGCEAAGITEPLVDFSVVGKHVIDDICGFLKKSGIAENNIEKVREYMTEKNGGHKGGIWTFSGFDKIKPTSKELGGDQYWADREKAYRAARINQKRTGIAANDFKGVIDVARQYIKNTADRLDNIESTVGDKYKNIRSDAVKVAMESAIKWTNELYPPKPEGMKALKNDDKRFEGK